jgi:hypothetical protein
MFPFVCSGGGETLKHQIQRSLRFNRSDSAYLDHTPSSVGNRKLLSFRVRIKRTTLGAIQVIASAGTASIDKFYFDASDRLCLDVLGTSILVTTRVFRDPHNWIDVGFELDVGNGTATQRAKIFINEAEATAYTTDTRSAIANTDTNWNNTVVHYLGRDNGGNYFGGYMCEPCLVDGSKTIIYSQLDSTINVRVPVKPNASWGTNGFYLDFFDNSNTTAATLGADRSGNGNNFTPNNFSVSAGIGNDSLVDVPTMWGTDTGVGGELRGNYSTLSPHWRGSGTNGAPNIPTNGGLTTGTGQTRCMGSVPLLSGKWYFEFTVGSVGDVSTPNVGIGRGSAIYIGSTNFAGSAANSGVSYRNGGSRWLDGVETTSWGSTYTTNDVIGVAIDADTGKVWFRNNGTWQASGDPVAGTNPAATLSADVNYPYIPFVGTLTNEQNINFGQRPFHSAAPSGFKCICSTNMPEPSIKLSREGFDINLRVGTGFAGSVTGKAFGTNSIIWTKSRSIRNHAISSSTRGAGKFWLSNLVTDEVVSPEAITSFNSNGFSFGTDATLNTNAENFVDWMFRIGPSYGIDIVTYTGTGSNRTVSHGLGAVPEFLIVKPMITAGTDYAASVWHKGLAGTAYQVLNSTAAQTTGATWWNSTTPTASVFSLGTAAQINANGDLFIAILFRSVKGFSRIGLYTGNGNADGAFVYCGFCPRWILVKRYGSTGSWCIWDTERNPYNPVTAKLFADTTAAEAGTTDLDVLSNGFKFRAIDSWYNAAGGTYVYMAFANVPEKYAKAA